MNTQQPHSAGSLVLCVLYAGFLPTAGHAAKLTLSLGDAQGLTFVGAVCRWDQDGNLRRPVDPKAKFDAPPVDAAAKDLGGGKWVFEKLAPGKYDLVIVAQDPATKKPIRLEGWHYAPVKEFDPFFPPTATTDDETRELLTDDIAKSRHYENKVVPLTMGGDKKAVRVLVMLIRDEPTSYTPGAGTIRHEIWQYTFNYGGWQKEKRTHVIDRLLVQVSELRQWTWLWDPKLGGIEVKDAPITIRYDLPKRSEVQKLKGLFPY